MAKITLKVTKAKARPQRAQQKITIGSLLPITRRSDLLTLGQAFKLVSLEFKSKVSLVPQVQTGDFLCPFKFVLGSRITIHARGEDAKAAVRALASLLEIGFDVNIKRVKKSIVLPNRLGMHTRPSANFVALASRFKSVIILEGIGGKVSALDIMGCQMLNLRFGDTAKIHAVGFDAKAAVTALSKLLESGFGELEGAIPFNPKAGG